MQHVSAAGGGRYTQLVLLAAKARGSLDVRITTFAVIDGGRLSVTYFVPVYLVWDRDDNDSTYPRANISPGQFESMACVQEYAILFIPISGSNVADVSSVDAGK